MRDKNRNLEESFIFLEKKTPIYMTRRVRHSWYNIYIYIYRKSAMMCTSRHPSHYRKSTMTHMFTSLAVLQEILATRICSFVVGQKILIIYLSLRTGEISLANDSSPSNHRIENRETKNQTGIAGKNKLTVYFLKGEPIDDDPEVVKEGEGNDHRPIVTETSRGIEDEGPIRGTRTKTFRPRLTRVTSATALLLLLLHRVPPRKDNQGKDDYAKSYQNDSSFFFLILTHRKRQEYVYFLDFENF